MAEVYPKIQQHMQLDKRMLFVAELFLPTGETIKSFAKLVEAAKAHTPIMIGCGEPFDASRVPDAMLEFHLNGGGRKGVKATHKQVANRRKQQQHERADQVREQGHGVVGDAAAIAKDLDVEAKREQVGNMRQQYMVGLLKHAEEQQMMIDAVHHNVANRRIEAEESRLYREEYERERMERLSLERQQQAADLEASRTEALEQVRLTHDAVRSGTSQQQQGEARQPWLW